MKTLFLDIETIPDQRPDALEAIRATITPPANMSKPETIAKWMAEKAGAAAEEKWRKTSFDGSAGEIICIGCAVDDDAPIVFSRSLEDPEDYVLKRFYDFAADSGLDQITTVVGHYVKDFDLRFLFQRSVINNVKPSFPLRTEQRYGGDFVFDTMLAWAGWGNRISLANLCAALGIPVKENGLDGSKVWDAVNDGRISEVAEYCAQDVEATRAVYKRLTFAP